MGHEMLSRPPGANWLMYKMFSFIFAISWRVVLSSCSQKYLKRSHRGYNDMLLIRVPPLQLTDPSNRPTCRCPLPKKSFSRKDLPCCQRKLKSNCFLFLLTLSLPGCHLKITPQECVIWNSYAVSFSFSHLNWKRLLSKCTILKVIRYRTGKYTVCRRECISLPGNFTDWGSEGVNTQWSDITWSPKGKQHPCNHYLCNL